MKILVLTKKRVDSYGNPYGLNNSASFITIALGVKGHHVDTVAVEDANAIDAVVSKHRPTIVLIEALWATPAKLAELTALHPRIKWLVRIHSNVPFLALEGQAIRWIQEMAQNDALTVVANNAQTADELTTALDVPVGYLPNVYLKPVACPKKEERKLKRGQPLHVSCFGAIRPFKNHLIQALAAMWVAELRHQTLHFHINATRVEQKGDPVLQNLVAAFEGTNHELVFHDWQNHPKFLKTIAGMDLGLQVSFTESFNIVAADHVHVGVPVVVSPEIQWLAGGRTASPTSMNNIAAVMIEAIREGKRDVGRNTKKLARYNTAANEVWQQFLGKLGQ